MLRILVRDADTGAPVAGARIEACPHARLLKVLGSIGLHMPAGRRLRANLVSVATTDAQGIAELGVDEETWVLEARAGMRWGSANLLRLPADGRAEIRIGADRELRVRVTDAAGQPRAGVRVAARRQRSTPNNQYESQVTESEPPDGVATFLHFQRDLQHGPGWHVTFAFPVRDPPCLAVDVSTPQDIPDPLVLPPTGGLCIHIRNADGEAPYVGDCLLDVDARADGALLWPKGSWAWPSLDPGTGDAVLPFLGLDLQLQVKLSHRGHQVASAVADGPHRAGEIVACVLRLDRPALRLARGRFVRNDGRSWPAGPVHAQALLEPMPDEYPPDQEIAVTADGRFVLEIRNALPAGGSRRYQFRAPHPDGAGVARATVALDRDVPREGLELGDVVLDHGPLLVAGRVVDDQARPLAGVQLELLARTATGQRRGRATPDAGTERTGPDGRFALFLPPGEPDPGQLLVLAVTCKGFLDERGFECNRGDASLTLVLQQAGGLSGSFVLGNGITAADLWAWFVEAGRAPGQGMHRADIRKDGTFTAEQLPAGFLDFTVYRLGPGGMMERKPALRIEALLVTAGRVDADPRLQQLRVEPTATIVNVRVLGPGSAPLAGAVADAAGPRPVLGEVAGSDGVCRVRVARLPADIEVHAYGYRSRLLTGVTADCEVTLEHGVAVRLCADIQAIAPRYRLFVHLRDVGADGRIGEPTSGRAWPFMKHAFDADGNLDVELPGPGTYAAKIFVAVTEPGGDVHTVNLAPEPLRLTVQESSTRQAIHLGIPQSAVDEAVNRAR